MRHLGAMALSILLGSAPWPVVSSVSGQQPAAQPEPEQRTIVIPRATRRPELQDFLQQSSSVTPGSIDGSPAATPVGVMVTNFRQREPGDGTPVSQETVAYLSYDDDNLYVVFVCQDERGKIRANIARREDIEADDAVVLYLDTFNDRKRAYQFTVNPRGVQLDGIVTEGQDDDLSFDAVWQSEGRLTDDGYIVRMEIPFRSLRFARSSNQTWGLALGRLIRRENEESYWPYITEREKGFVPQFATAEGLSEISPGRNMQLNPYATASRARVLDEGDDDTTPPILPGFRTLDDQRVGLDAKLVLRDALTLDGTVNPDFSQVETDDPQVSQNERFEVFFPEKRPFFLENSGYFQTPVNLFFSRRIQDPGAGLRLTGKAGRWAVGAIGLNDRTPEEVAEGDAPADRDARVGAFRVQRELGEESTLGLLVTDRTLASSFNRMVSLDSRLRFGEAWAFSGQVIRSDNRDLERVRKGGFGAMAELELDGRNLDYTAGYLHFDSDFNAPLGFVKRVGIRQMEHELQYQWVPDGDLLVSFGPTFNVQYIWSDGRNESQPWHPKGVILDRSIGGGFQFELVGETQLEVEHKREFERFEGFGFRPHSTQISLETAWLKWLTLDLSYEWGTGVNHDPAELEDDLGNEVEVPFLTDATEAEVQLAFRPFPALRWDLAFVHGRLTTNQGGLPPGYVCERARCQVAREFELRSKVNYQFSRFLSLRAIVDYEAEDANPELFDSDERERELGYDVLMTYLVRPGTALHVGFSDEFENVELVGDEVEFKRSPTTSIGRQFFVKLSYLLRF